MQSELKDWWQQAEADFKTAKDNIASGNYYASVVFSQQSAEKAFKSVYILKNKKIPPKIHDLIELGRLVNAPPEILLPAGTLSGTYFTSRYPGAGPDIPVRYYTKEKAQEHLKEAEVILQWAKTKIK